MLDSAGTPSIYICYYYNNTLSCEHAGMGLNCPGAAFTTMDYL